MSNWIEEAHKHCRTSMRMLNCKHETKDIQMPRVTHANQLVVSSFKYLSDMFLNLENTGIDIQKLDSMRCLASPSGQFLHYASNTPQLLKTCLLIDKDKIRQRIFNFHYIKRCLLMDHAVGDWIVIFLANKETSSRVIECFESLSKLTPSDALGMIKPQINDVAQFRSRMEKHTSKIAKMEFILPASFMLNENGMKRASYSYPVRRILDLSMTDPSLLGLLTFDWNAHLLLIFAHDGECIGNFS